MWRPSSRWDGREKAAAPRSLGGMSSNGPGENLEELYLPWSAQVLQGTASRMLLHSCTAGGMVVWEGCNRCKAK